MKSRPFSLTELLVVMAVIAILAGMLMPALGSFRRSADKSFCVNNLKQIGQAVALFKADFKDEYPAWLTDVFPSYMKTLGGFHCKRDTNGSNSATNWHLNIPDDTGKKAGTKFSDVYDFPRTHTRSDLTTEQRNSLKVSYMYEFNGEKAISSDAKNSGSGATGNTWQEYKLSLANLPLFKSRQTTFPMVRCFWHTSGYSNSDKPVINLSMTGNVFYCTVGSWENGSWTD